MDRTPLYTGKAQEARCGRCGAVHTGMVFQNRTRWMIRFQECGHVKVLGYTRPTDELERKGLLNAPQEGDPYAEQVAEHRRAKERERLDELADHERHKAQRTIKDRYLVM